MHTPFRCLQVLQIQSKAMDLCLAEAKCVRQDTTAALGTSAGAWAALQGTMGVSLPSHGAPRCAPAAPAGLRPARPAAPRTRAHALWRPRRAPPARRSSGPAAPAPQTRRRPAHAPQAGVSSFAIAVLSRTPSSRWREEVQVCQCRCRIGANALAG